MTSDYRCFFCFVKAFEKLLLKADIPSARKKEFTDSMVKMYLENKDNFTTPLFARDLHALLREYTGNADPYKSGKKEYNDLALSMVPQVEKIINESADKKRTALKAAIAGNIIDFAIGDSFDVDSALNHALTIEPAIDHSDALLKAIDKASSILYLGDNAGEIVFDRLFLSTIDHPNVTYVVRGGPVINDVTTEDAEYTGINKVANVISSGFDAPSTVPELSSPLLREMFRDTDLIISKGQGNLEGLIGYNDIRIFFLLMVKCDVMAEFLGVKKGSTVIYNKMIARKG